MITNKGVCRPNWIDILKITAIILMIVDHLGYFIFQDIHILRLIGRYSFPLFLLITGLQNRYSVHASLIYIALFVQVAIFVFGLFSDDIWQPISILGSIIFCKLFLAGITKSDYFNHNTKQIILFIVCVLGIIFAYKTSKYIEYGTLGLSIGILGYFIKNSFNQQYMILLILGCVIGLTSVNREFQFTNSQIALFMTSMSAVLIAIQSNYNMLFTGVRVSKNIGHVITFLSTNSLYIYIAHLFVIIVVSYFIQIGK